jgi:UV excision repair protein RAD23
MAMGFSRDQVQAAMRAAYHNPDRAAEFLFNGIPPSSSQSQSQSRHRNNNNNPFAGLAHLPQFQQMRDVFLQQPQMIPVFLNQLAQSQPDLAAMIQQHPEEFADMLAGRNDNDGGGGAGHSTTTAEEDRQVESLAALGFPLERARQVWLLCGRDETMAANYLLEHGHDNAMN